MVAVICWPCCGGEEKHKYLGRTISGHLKRRGLVELQHRIQIGWMTFHKYKCILTNKHIALKLRLQLFDAVVSPTILFGLATLPVTKSDNHTVDKLQRKDASIDCWLDTT